VELTEKMEKQTAEYLSQEKVYEDAMEAIQKENEQLRQQIRSLRVDIRNLENAKKEAEEQRAEMPSLEFVSTEIKALRRALILMRRKNSELLARGGLKELATTLRPISSSEERVLLHMVSLEHELLQQDQDYYEDDGNRRREPSWAAKNQNTLTKANVEVLQFLDRLQAAKASNKVLDLTLPQASPVQQWANKQLEAAKVQMQSKHIMERLRETLVTYPQVGATVSSSTSPNFASFATAEFSKTLADVARTEKEPVGKVTLPLHASSDSASDYNEDAKRKMHELLVRLKDRTGKRAQPVALTPHQLRRVHSLIL